VHYLSDVAAGRTLGAAVYQRISATPAYAEDIAQAKAEIAAQPVLACGK
jgi:membrane-associated phospholipid phosphatase